MGCKKAGYVGNATRLWAALCEVHPRFFRPLERVDGVLLVCLRCNILDQILAAMNILHL